MAESPLDLDIEPCQKELPELSRPLRGQGYRSMVEADIGSPAGIHQCHSVGQRKIRLKKPTHRRESFVVGRLQWNLSTSLASQRCTRQLIRRRRHKADNRGRLRI